MTVQFAARVVVGTFTIIFLLGCFCMSWQIFIGYRNIIRSGHNRPHKAPCHTVVGRRMRRAGRPRVFFLYSQDEGLYSLRSGKNEDINISF